MYCTEYIASEIAQVWVRSSMQKLRAMGTSKALPSVQEETSTAGVGRHRARDWRLVSRCSINASKSALCSMDAEVSAGRHHAAWTSTYVVHVHIPTHGVFSCSSAARC